MVLTKAAKLRSCFTIDVQRKRTGWLLKPTGIQPRSERAEIETWWSCRQSAYWWSYPGS